MRTILFAAALLVTALPAEAQNFTGTIRDAQGTPVARYPVIVENLNDANAVTVTYTNNAGVFEVSDLSSGQYVIVPANEPQPHAMVTIGQVKRTDQVRQVGSGYFQAVTPDIAAAETAHSKLLSGWDTAIPFSEFYVDSNEAKDQTLDLGTFNMTWTR